MGRYQEAEARAALLRAQIAQHQQSVMSDALEVEQRLNEVLATLSPTLALTPIPTQTQTLSLSLSLSLTLTPTRTLTRRS